MKTNIVNLLPTIWITGVVASLIVMSNIVLSSATMQSNDTNTSAMTAAESSSSNGPVVMHIDSAISAIKSGNNDEGRKQLLQAEKLLEGVESAVDSEKRIEAAIKALKDGDSGSMSQAEEAKKLLTT